MSMTTNKQTLRDTADRDWFEQWFKRDFHPNKTGPYIKDQMFFAIQAARAPLLDELEASHKSNEFLKGQLSELANFNPDWDKLEASYESWREIAAELLVAKGRISELEAAEKRIAELEAREVREEGNQFLVVRHPGKAPVIKHFTGELDAYLLELNALDPLVTIDIITHRYYGVGGQWVQDADEYLAAAGISVKGE